MAEVAQHDREYNWERRREPLSPEEKVVANLRARGLMPVLEPICERLGIMLLEVVGHSKEPSIIRCRHDCWLALRDMKGRDYSYPEIGDMMGGFHHSTIMNGVDKARWRAALVKWEELDAERRVA